MISYERFLEISIHMDRKNHALEQQALLQLNTIKKSLNIPIKENLKKTIVNKKEDISQIFKLLNKITDKNYDKLKEELFSIIEKMDITEDIKKITELIFKIASSNIYYSVIFAKLYTELISKKQEFYLVFQEHFDIHTSDIDQLNYVDPNVNYDEYCNYVKRVEHVKSSLMFFINLMKTNVCNLDNIVELCIKLQTTLINSELANEQNEEYINNIHIIIKECIDYILFHEKMELLYTNVLTIQQKFKTKKISFKCLDILDIIKEYK
jgi:hypothetical protein